MVQEVIAVYDDYRKTGTNQWTYDTAARDLAYQVGSLTKYVMQLRGDRHHEDKTREEIIAKISDELADILAEVLFISCELQIDLASAWEAMVASDERKIASREPQDRLPAQVN
jgi:NTP pyrophosphatase (non-canonical NTP hydrolase)